MRHMKLSPAPQAITDVKSRIVFETPEPTDRQSIPRNRSYSAYKLDSELLQQTGQARQIPQSPLRNPSLHKPEKADRNTNLTVEGIKKKYGFTSSTSKPAASLNSSPLQNISNREKAFDNYRPTVTDLKSKYESKKHCMFSGVTGYPRESENQSLVLEKYRADSKRKPERELFRETAAKHNRELFNETHRFSSVTPPQIAADLAHKRLPSSVADGTTPSFNDQLKDRNHDWLSNLNRVQERIRAALGG